MFESAEKRILTALADAMLPMREEPFCGLDVPALVEEFMAGAPGALALSTRLGLWAVELGPAAWGYGARRFSRMDGPAALAYLRGWDQSRRYAVRSLFFALKVVVLGMVYDRPEIAEGVCKARKSIPSSR